MPFARVGCLELQERNDLKKDTKEWNAMLRAAHLGMI